MATIEQITLTDTHLRWHGILLDISEHHNFLSMKLEICLAPKPFQQFYPVSHWLATKSIHQIWLHLVSISPFSSSFFPFRFVIVIKYSIICLQNDPVSGKLFLCSTKDFWRHGMKMKAEKYPLFEMKENYFLVSNNFSFLLHFLSKENNSLCCIASDDR